MLIKRNVRTAQDEDEVKIDMYMCKDFKRRQETQGWSVVIVLRGCYHSTTHLSPGVTHTTHACTLSAARLPLKSSARTHQATPVRTPRPSSHLGSHPSPAQPLSGLFQGKCVWFVR